MAKLVKRKGKFKLPKGFRISVGVHGDDGAKQHEGGLTISELATMHEYGGSAGDNPPERAPVRRWFDESKSENQKIIRRAMRNPDTAPEAVALKFQAGIQKKIANRELPPPNAQSTIDQKGSSTPLVDKGVLRSSYVARAERTQ